MKPAALRELGVVKTASPCGVPWESMRGEGARRFCAKCRLYVYDFAELSSEEARQLLISTEGRLCARIFTRADGTVLTRDCPRGLARLRRRAMAPFIAVAAWVVAAVVAVVALVRGEPTRCGLSRFVVPEAETRLPLRSGNPRGREVKGALGMLLPTGPQPNAEGGSVRTGYVRGTVTSGPLEMKRK